MNINEQQTKTIKAKQLRRIIREAIEEVLREDANALITTKTGTKSVTYENPTELNSLKSDSNVSSITTTSGQKIKEGDLEEMARIAKGFRLADPNFDASQYSNKRVSGTSLSDVINFFRENPGAEKTQLQSQFNFVRPQIANAIVNGLLDAGVLVKLGAGGEVEATPEPGEERPETIDGPEALFIGSGNSLSQYFDDIPNDTGEEDFNDEEEPTVGDIEPGSPAPAGGMSDEDYEAFMKYSDLNDRLSATKSNLLKLKRRKGGTAGDISDKASTEEQRLRDLKKSLEDRINILISGSDYLKKKIEKETGKPVEQPVAIEPVETPEEEVNESLDVIDAHTKRKLQYYAGIIK